MQYGHRAAETGGYNTNAITKTHKRASVRMCDMIRLESAITLGHLACPGRFDGLGQRESLMNRSRVG